MYRVLLKSLAGYKAANAQGEIPQCQWDEEQLPGNREINGDYRTHTALGDSVFAELRFLLAREERLHGTPWAFSKESRKVTLQGQDQCIPGIKVTLEKHPSKALKQS